MSTPSDCCTPCATVPPVNVPGAPGNDGAPGANGTPGGNAYTVTITPIPPANFVIPNVMGTVTAWVADTSWMVPGQIVIIQGPANFRVISVSSPNTAVLQFVANAGDLPPGSVIAVGAGVSPSAVGISAFTHTTSDFIIPAIGSTANVFVINSEWVEAGVTVYINGDWFVVDSTPPNTTEMVLRYANVTSNVHGGINYNVVSGSQITFGAPNGENAYTLIIAPTVATPTPVGSNVTVNVANSGWMVAGENVIIGGPWGSATFQVVGTPATPTTALLKFLGYPNDVAPNVTMTVGSRVAVCGLLYTNETHDATAAGTEYVVDITPQLLAFGTTNPSITLGGAGTYLITGRVRYDYKAYDGTGATPTVTTLLNSSTLGPISNSNSSWVGLPEDYSLQAYVTAHCVPLNPVVYVTGTAGDVIEVWGSYNIGPTGGHIVAREATIVAVKLAP